jgi:hypothetical protein
MAAAAAAARAMALPTRDRHSAATAMASRCKLGTPSLPAAARPKATAALPVASVSAADSAVSGLLAAPGLVESLLLAVAACMAAGGEGSGASC